MPNQHRKSDRGQLELLHLDDSLIAVAKPSGLAVHRGWARDRVTALPLARELAGTKVFPVHRLDRATSGVLIFALSSEIARILQESFQAGSVVKRYLALVRGMPSESGVIDHPIPRKKAKDSEKVDAVTEYRRLATIEKEIAPSSPMPFSLVEARPRTGRLHQIRRHLKHLSHPIVGDVNYGKGKINRHFRERYGLHRLALHAFELGFEHPATGERLELFAPLPDDLAQPLIEMGFELSGFEISSRFRSET